MVYQVQYLPAFPKFLVTILTQIDTESNDRQGLVMQSVGRMQKRC